MFGKICQFSRLTVTHAKRRNVTYCQLLQQSTYSSDDKAYILKKINEKDIPKKAISSNHADKIFDYVEKNRLNSLEDLLKVNGIGPKLLRKVCDKILEVRDGIEITTAPVRKKRDCNLIVPHIDEARKKRLLNVVAVHIGVENISWALVGILTKNVLDWDLVPNANEIDNLYNNVQMVVEVASLIPNGDLYLMEDSGFGRQRIDLSKSQLSSMLLTALQITRGESVDKPIVALMKQSVKNRIYNASVGSERVSLQNHVIEMMEERSKTDCVTVSRELKDRFYRLKPISKEDLAQSLLLATAFINVIINNRTIRATQSSV